MVATLGHPSTARFWFIILLWEKAKEVGASTGSFGSGSERFRNRDMACRIDKFTMALTRKPRTML